ncbi:MAG: vitamin K-dependent gamma-carboxylase [Planctomycetota bacterium]|nr:MAG: vitamin K-dependent gamma-carboxylase [Planctomycetota bacterium]
MSLESHSTAAMTADPQNRFKALRGWLSEQVSASSLVVFRISFGLMVAFWVLDYLQTDRVRLLCAPDMFHFTYSGFSWVRPWPGYGMFVEFVVMLFAALMIATGAMYRVATVIFALGFTHFFLIDRTNYQNHYYLIMLLSWLMTFLPANRLHSVDVLNGSVKSSGMIPRWCLLLLQFHVALPYVFGGIAKIDGDWLSGEPIKNVLRIQGRADGVEGWLSETSVAHLFTWGGLIFDLLVVPAILWRRTRIVGFLLAIGFHLSNSVMFNIHVFPWLMIAATTVFFAPDWPNKYFRWMKLGTENIESSSSVSETGGKLSTPAAIVLLVYCSFHILWPVRHFTYEGNTGWTEQGHYFSWRMMLRGKTVGLRYYLTDAETGVTQQADIRQFLHPEQQIKFAKDPLMILDLAHGLATESLRRTGKQTEVRALVLASLNGRKPQLLIDPAVNLAAQPKFAFHRPWIVPLHESLRSEPWTIPLNEWEQHVDLPKLPYLNLQTRISANHR